MKRIGQTDHGTIMIEMTEDELVVFNHLAMAIDGRSFDHLNYQRDPGAYPDFTGVFGAIEAFTLAKYNVNEIRRIADDFDRVLFVEY